MEAANCVVCDKLYIESIYRGKELFDKGVCSEECLSHLDPPIDERKIKHNELYSIALYKPSKHIGGVSHTAYYTCGFWNTPSHELICLHRDVKSYTPVDPHGILPKDGE